jgi:hypothetical protein
MNPLPTLSIRFLDYICLFCRKAKTNFLNQQAAKTQVRPQVLGMLARPPCLLVQGQQQVALRGVFPKKRE